jgi:hypothetical protein
MITPLAHRLLQLFPMFASDSPSTTYSNAGAAWITAPSKIEA